MLIGPKIGVVDQELDHATYGDDMRRLMRMLQALIEANCINLTTSVPPASPNNGDTYIVGPAPSGLWAGQTNNVAYWTVDDPNVPTGKWEFYAPLKGWLIENQADGNLYVFNGTAWVVFQPAASAVQASFPIRNSVIFARGDAITSFGHGVTAVGTQASSSPTATETSGRALTSTAVASGNSVLSCGAATGANPGQGFLSVGTTQIWTYRMKFVQTASFRFWCGLLDISGSELGAPGATWANDAPNRNLIAFRFSSAVDTHWQCICQTSNVARTIVDSGVTPDNVNSTLLTITLTPIGAVTTANFYINGVLVASINTNLPALSFNIAAAMIADNKNTATAGSVVMYWSEIIEAK